MSELDSVVSVNITANTVTPSRAGFGTALILGYHTRNTDDYRVYTDTAGMADDGFVSGVDEEYDMARALFSQNPAPERVVVARMTSAPSFAYTVTVTSATEGQHIKLTVVDTAGVHQAIDRTIPAASSTSAEATAVAALIDALTGVSASAVGAVITVTPTSAGHRPICYAPTNCTLWESTADASYDDRLAALQLLNDDWYAVTIDSDSDANVQAVAAWVEAQKKVFVYSTNDTRELGNGTSVTGAALETAAYARTFWLWAERPSDHAQLAWLGMGLPQTPGSITWAHKTLAGVTVKQLTPTQKLAVEATNGNHYLKVAGINVTRWGTVASGEKIDIVHGLDALEADIQESAFSVLANNGKVPYTGGGFDLIANAILGALRRFEGDQALLVTGSSVVIMPAPSAINPADKALGKLPGIKFTATLQGAVLSMTINGTVSL